MDFIRIWVYLFLGCLLFIFDMVDFFNSTISFFLSRVFPSKYVYFYFTIHYLLLFPFLKQTLNFSCLVLRMIIHVNGSYFNRVKL